MTAPARAHKHRGHIHLPSVHVRKDGAGFDYDEDLWITGNQAKRIVRFVAIENEQPTLIRQTYDVLSDEDLRELRVNLDWLLLEHSPETNLHMQERAYREFERQQAIAKGEETACRGCGCSDSRGCSGGCVWATPALCSRCV